MNVKKILMWFMILVFVVGFGTVGFAETPSKNSELYPTTPEGVVKAFVGRDFKGGPDRWKHLEGKYTVWTDAPGWDTTTLILSYKVNKIREYSKAAEVKVEYKVVGEMYFDDIGHVFKEAKTNEVLIFKLIKKDNQWKIESPQEPPHYDVKKVIKGLKELQNEKKDPQKLSRIKHVLTNIENKVKKLKTNKN